MSILNKYKRWNNILTIDKSYYYDFVLSQDNNTFSNNGNDCLIMEIDINNKNCIVENSILKSHSGYTYNNAVNNGYELDNIGLTATDNGLITFNKFECDENDYLEIIRDSVAKIKKDDKSLYLFPVSGNTCKYTYDCEIINDSGDTYYSFNGGFLQGVFKGYGFDYQVLPQYINDTITLEFDIRPRSDYRTTGSTLNNISGNNSDGIFFYIGTRAENKFLQFYDYDFNSFKQRENVLSSGGTIYKVTTSDGVNITERYNNDIVTDNGYLIYNRTCDGFTTNNWNRGDLMTIITKPKEYKTNPYLLFNRTCSGYTVDNVEYISGETKNALFEVLNDLNENSFALRITNDGRIGYKYLSTDDFCGTNGIVKEEYSFPNIIKYDMWNKITVCLRTINGELDECEKPVGKRKMKIFIYVNGYLKFISQELNEIRLRELNERDDKQEFVPFNISLGGGTQGLMESTWINSYNGFPYILPLEEHFAGSFIGDIKSFKIYDCMLEYNEIKKQNKNG